MGANEQGQLIFLGPIKEALTAQFYETETPLSYSTNRQIYKSPDPVVLPNPVLVYSADDISGSFNGTSQIFTLTRGEFSIPTSQLSTYGVFVFLGGVVQKPNEAYFIQGESAFLKPDYIIADVHTAPTDAAGGPVGWVYHVGTGPVNLAVLLTEDEDGVMTSFVGPVMSYYEYVSMNFKRFTDQEWSAAFETTSQQEFRPEFSQSFLHTENTWYYDSRHFVVSVPEDGPRPETGFKLDGNYPNPFNNGTVITFQVPSRLAHEPVELTIHTVDGRLLTTLLNQRLPSGTYSVRWEAQAASGVYIYSVKVGSEIRTGRMTLVK
jgi:hypothetical protein